MRITIAILLICFSSALACAQGITIMIDPGHGGSDPGHESSNKKHLKEKDLNLIIAKKFGAYLTEKLTNVTVIYTRTDDSFPSLDQRVEMANSKKVDYFISIHCNANPNKNIHGTESHVHDMSSSKSVKLAKEFEREFREKAGRKSRGVKDSDDREHTLQVLKFTQMTSVLVECGFMTNAKEATYLNTAYGQDIIASALYRGMKSYLKTAHPNISFSKSTKKKASTSASKENKTEISSSNSSSKKYAIQIMSSKEWMDTEKGAFAKLDKPVTREQVAQTGYKYCYYVKGFTTKADADTYLTTVKKKGFPDAIVVEKK